MAQNLILVAIVLFLCLMAEKLSGKVGMPALILFMGVGMLFGSDGILRIEMCIRDRYSSFLQRAYDQIIHDVCIQNLPVVFCVDRAGLVGADGETHQGIFDLSYLSMIPNMTVCAPKNKYELYDMLYFAYQYHLSLIHI